MFTKPKNCFLKLTKINLPNVNKIVVFKNNFKKHIYPSGGNIIQCVFGDKNIIQIYVLDFAYNNFCTKKKILEDIAVIKMNYLMFSHDVFCQKKKKKWDFVHTDSMCISCSFELVSFPR